MSRRWTEFVAAVGDRIGLGTATLLLLLAALLTGAAWYWFPRWLPWRWWGRFARYLAAHRPRGRAWWRWRRRPGARRWRWRRRRPAPAVPELEPQPGLDLPELPAQSFVSLADWLAAQGRYAEAVRERLRGIVRVLVDAGVIANPPGATVTELAQAASAVRPVVRPAVGGAGAVFSEIWYGQRPATAGEDRLMRGYAEAVDRALVPVPAPGVPA